MYRIIINRRSGITTTTNYVYTPRLLVWSVYLCHYHYHYYIGMKWKERSELPLPLPPSLTSPP